MFAVAIAFDVLQRVMLTSTTGDITSNFAFQQQIWFFHSPEIDYDSDSFCEKVPMEPLE